MLKTLKIRGPCFLPYKTVEVSGMHWAWRDFYSQMCTKGPRMLRTEGCFYRERNAKPVFCQKAGVAMLSSLVPFVQSVWPNTSWHRILFQVHSHKLFFFFSSQSIEPIFMEGVTWTLQRISMLSYLNCIELTLFLKEIWVCFIVLAGLI